MVMVMVLVMVMVMVMCAVWYGLGWDGRGWDAMLCHAMLRHAMPCAPTIVHFNVDAQEKQQQQEATSQAMIVALMQAEREHAEQSRAQTARQFFDLAGLRSQLTKELGECEKAKAAVAEKEVALQAALEQLQKDKREWEAARANRDFPAQVSRQQLEKEQQELEDARKAHRAREEAHEQEKQAWARKQQADELAFKEAQGQLKREKEEWEHQYAALQAAQVSPLLPPLPPAARVPRNAPPDHRPGRGIAEVRICRECVGNSGAAGGFTDNDRSGMVSSHRLRLEARGRSKAAATARSGMDISLSPTHRPNARICPTGKPPPPFAWFNPPELTLTNTQATPNTWYLPQGVQSAASGGRLCETAFHTDYMFICHVHFLYAQKCAYIAPCRVRHMCVPYMLLSTGGGGGGGRCSP